MENVKAKKKFSLENLSWKAIMTLASIGAGLGMAIGKFL